MEMSLFFNINVNAITKNEHQPQAVIILLFMVFIIISGLKTTVPPVFPSALSRKNKAPNCN